MDITSISHFEQLDSIHNRLSIVNNQLGRIIESSPDYSDIMAYDVGLIAFSSLVIAGFSMVYTYKTFQSQKQTEANTSTVSSEAVKGWLEDLIRHFYRNMVVIKAIERKLDAGIVNNQYTGYPSEEHILKLAPSYEWISMVNSNDLTKTNRGEDISLFNLQKLFVNFEIELSTALDHFKDKDMSIDVKKRDLSTMMFKSKSLAYKCFMAFNIYIESISKSESHFTIYDVPRCCVNFLKNLGHELLMFVRKPVSEDSTVMDNRKQAIKEANLNYLQESLRNRNNYKELTSEQYIEFFANIFSDGDVEQFEEKFQNDVSKECGNNSEGSPKIYIINF